MKSLSKLISLTALIAAGAAGTLTAPVVRAASKSPVTVIHAKRAGVSLPVTTMRRFAPGNTVAVNDAGAPNTDAAPDGPSGGRVQTNLPIPLKKSRGFHDPFVQRGFARFSARRATGPTITTGANFNGVSSATGKCGCAPPDTNAAVGLHYVVESVNSAFAVYRKDGSMILPPTPINAVFFGLGGPCQNRNDGDPIVLYDSGADRWLISEFTAASPYAECVAISTTGDPTGSYYRYEFDESTVNFGDYPKIGIWPVSGNNVYAMTTNVFADATLFSGPQMWMMDRAKMLTGDPSAVMVGSNPLGSESNPMLPADADQATGPQAPASGSPEYFVEYPQEVTGSDPGAIVIFEGMFNQANPSASTFTQAPGIPPTTGAFNNAFTCGPTSRDCIPQPGSVSQTTACAQTPAVVCNLDVLADRYMYRLAYRRINNTDSLVTNFTVNAGTGADQAAPQWLELINPGGAAPSISQEGAYAPGADGLNRWMGSVDVDREGNILLGYSASSSKVYPSIRVAGRSPSDPAGQLGKEVQVFGGTSSQTGVDRWGDYSSMQVDPTDGCTFWYAQEYGSSPPAFSWATRVASFRFSSCNNTVASMLATSPATSSAGSVDYVTVTLRDAKGYDASTYRGTVRLTSSDRRARLPGSYTFTANDSGSHTFPVVFNTMGAQTVTVTDSRDGSLKATAKVGVTSPARKLGIGIPKKVGLGMPFSINVRAEGAGGRTLSDYTGTVRFSSNDRRAVLPPAYTFTAADHGAHTFTAAGTFLTGAVKLFTLGKHAVKVVDTGTQTISGTRPTRAVIINTFVKATGNNANSCRVSTKPCQTINAAIQKTSYKGTVFVQPGTYTENVTIDRSLRLVGMGARATDTTVDGGAASSTIVVDPGMTAEIDGLQATNGSGATLGVGGGIANFGAKLTLRDDIITGNTNAGGLGGGIYNDNGNNSILNIYNSTISNNSASNANGPTGASGLGGAIYDRGASMLIVNSTITGNSAGVDGGIRFRLGPATVQNSTIDGNSVAESPGNTGTAVGGGIDDPGINGSRIVLGNTIVSGNTATNAATTSPDDCNGAFITAGSNFVGDGQNGGACSGFKDGVKGDKVGNDTTQKNPLLGALADNGGRTPTQAPGKGSGAIDAGSAAICVDRSTVGNRDQRAFTRLKVGARCDIGAVEVNSPGPPPATIVYKGPKAFTSGSPGRPSARLTSPLNGTPISRRAVRFTLGKQTCLGVTNSKGVASCLLKHVSAKKGKSTLTVTFAGDSLGPRYAFSGAKAMPSVTIK